MSYDNTNSGVLFRNDKKQSDKHPDFTGTMDVEGREYWLSSWVNESKDGRKYFKMSLTPKDSQKPDQAPQQQIASEDVPF
jgi:uncharacterized protein (DUF736 family)